MTSATIQRTPVKKTPCGLDRFPAPAILTAHAGGVRVWLHTFACSETGMAQLQSALQFKSPLFQMTQTTPTCLWNDSASIDELTYSIDHGAVGATCNPSIAVTVLKKEMAVWKPRIHELVREMPQATE